MGNSGMIAGAFSSTSNLADKVLTTNGDILYYNSGRQRLAKEDNDDVLTLKSGLPSWEPAAGGGKLELIDSTLLGSDTDGIDTTFTAVDLTDISCLVVDCMLSTGSASSYNMIINDSSTSEYQQDGTSTTADATTIIERVNQADLLLTDGTATIINSHFILYPATTASNARGVMGIMQTVTGQPSTGQYDAYCINMDVNGTTEIDQIKVAAGVDLLAGSIMNIYKVSL